jgi:hypothetical protein
VETLAAMMEKDPNKRIQTCEEVIDRLKAWAGEAVSSPLDPEEARRRAEQSWETGSGSGDLSDTTVSFPEIAQQGGLRMVNGAMLQAEGELLAPIPVPIVAPPSSTPPAGAAAAGASAAIAAAPAQPTLRIIQQRPGARAKGEAAATEVAVADASAGRLSVTDVLNAIAAESGTHPVVTADGVPPIRRTPIEIESPSIMLPRRGSNRVVIRGIIAAAVVLVTAIALILITR